MGAGRGNINTAQVTATTTAGRLATVSATGTPRANGGILIKSLAANTQLVYIGNSSSVTSSTGFPLDAGGAVSLVGRDPSDIWVIAASGSQTVAVIYI